MQEDPLVGSSVMGKSSKIVLHNFRGWPCWSYFGFDMTLYLYRMSFITKITVDEIVRLSFFFVFTQFVIFLTILLVEIALTPQLFHLFTSWCWLVGWLKPSSSPLIISVRPSSKKMVKCSTFAFAIVQNQFAEYYFRTLHAFVA